MSHAKKPAPKLSYIALWCGEEFKWSTVHGVSAHVAHSHQGGPSGKFQSVCNAVDSYHGVVPVAEFVDSMRCVLAEIDQMTEEQKKRSYWVATQSRPTILTVTPETQEMYDQRLLEKRKAEKLSLLDRLRTAEAAADSARKALAALGLPEEEV